MSTPEWDEQRLTGTYERRSRIGNLSISPEDVETLVQKKFSPMRDKILETVKQRPGTFIERLAQQRDAIRAEEDIIPSNPDLCVRFIVARICRAGWEEAEELFQKSSHAFAVVWDHTYGIFLTVSSIIGAEQSLRGESHHVILWAMDIHEAITDVKLPVGDQTDLYLLVQKDRKEAADLLRRDPSAFLLLDHRVRQIEDEARDIGRQAIYERVHSYQVPELVIAGARLGRDLYKSLYPLAEKSKT